MPVIKSANVPAAAAPFSMRDIENQARAILLRARQQAEALLAEAQKEGEALKERSRAEGVALGQREGLARGMEEGRKAGEQQALTEHRAQLTDAVTALSAAMGELDASRRDLEADALREVVGLAAAVARRVTKRQGVIDPDVLSANLAEAMKLVVRAADVRVAVHPSQKATLAAALPKLKVAFPTLHHVEVVDDDKLSPGGCRVYSGHGEVDADLDAQLDRVIDDLLPDRTGSPEAA